MNRSFDELGLAHAGRSLVSAQKLRDRKPVPVLQSGRALRNQTLRPLSTSRLFKHSHEEKAYHIPAILQGAPVHSHSGQNGRRSVSGSVRAISDHVFRIFDCPLALLMQVWHCSLFVSPVSAIGTEFLKMKTLIFLLLLLTAGACSAGVDFRLRAKTTAAKNAAAKASAANKVAKTAATKAAAANRDAKRAALRATPTNNTAALRATAKAVAASKEAKAAATKAATANKAAQKAAAEVAAATKVAAKKAAVEAAEAAAAAAKVAAEKKAAEAAEATGRNVPL